MVGVNCGCYVLHVKQGYEDREKSIIAQFKALGKSFEWVLDYDRHEITLEILQKYKYSGTMRDTEISCCLKHITAWERIAEGSEDGGFVLEDDVLLDLKHFQQIAAGALDEFAALGHPTGCISLGDACALHVPWTKRKKGQFLYAADHIRATDSYWINRETSQQRLAWLKEHGFGLPADHMINTMDAALGIPILWLEPTIASQGSHTGRFASGIQLEQHSKIFDRLDWVIKKLRRQFLYPLLGIDLRISSKKKG